MTTPWKRWRTAAPHKIALQTEHGELSWTELCQTVDCYSAQLTKQGVVSGDVVTLVGKNHLDTLLVFLAAHQVGAICALTMPQPLAQLEVKFDTLYPQGQPALVWLAPSAQVTADELRGIKRPVTVLAFADMPVELSSHSHFQAYDERNLASLIFTSGSTGVPKAVAHTHQHHFASATGLLEWFHFNAQHCWLLSLPMYHVSGLSIVYRWLAAGACLKLGTGQLLDDIQGVSHASLVPVQLKRLLDSRIHLDLTHVLLGGSHIPQELGMQAATLGIETWLGYGMTEAASTVTARRVDNGVGAGKVIPNRKLEIRDGRIYIGGDTLASGYYQQGYLVSFTDEQGWFDSKDLGHWQQGDLEVIGRADNLFISGGENIHCEEIEAVLNRHPDVALAMIVPMEDATFGHRPVAVMSTTQPLEKAYWDEWCANYLEKFKWPIAYFAMPAELTTSGIKVSRTALKAWLLERISA